MKCCIALYKLQPPNVSTFDTVSSTKCQMYATAVAIRMKDSRDPQDPTAKQKIRIRDPQEAVTKQKLQILAPQMPR